jgi:hypothetical protein
MKSDLESLALRARVAIAFAGIPVVVALLLLASGCGHKPLKVQVTTGLGPDPHQWTVTISATGDGQADAGVFLTYPDGHTADTMDCLVQGGARPGGTLDDLSRGTYSWTVYASPVGTGVKNVFALPQKDLTAKNRVSAGSFTIH